MIYLTSKIPWFGEKTGYERLPEFVENSISVAPRYGIVPRAIGKLASLGLRIGAAPQHESFARLDLALRMIISRNSAAHILWGEDNLPVWSRFPDRYRRKTVYTFHQPPSQWTDGVRFLCSVSSAILLYGKDLDFFRQQAPKARFEFVHYGTDTEFFMPGTCGPDLRLLYNGVHLRNIPMFSRVVRLLNARFPDVKIDALVPLHRRADPGFGNLSENPSITWHAGLDDEGLRKLYQRSFLQIIPLNDSGANTAIVEALACGLPPVTTDVGGIRDYGGDSVFPIVENDDDEGMMELIGSYINNPRLRNSVAEACRNFALQNLAWPVVADRHREAYKSFGLI